MNLCVTVKFPVSFNEGLKHINDYKISWIAIEIQKWRRCDIEYYNTETSDVNELAVINET